MATQYATVEVWVMVDANGDYVAQDDETTLAEQYEERIGALSDAGGLRRVKITVRVPLPTPIDLAAEVEADEEIGELKAVG